MSADKRLKENNIVLPEAPAPVGSYVASKIIGYGVGGVQKVTHNSRWNKNKIIKTYS